MKKFNKNEIILIIMEAIKTCTGTFTGTFLTAYFICDSISNVANYSIYKIVGDIVSIITCFIISRIIKKRNKMLSFRIGIITSCLYLLSIAIFKKSLIENSWIIGVLLGLSNSTYYMPYNYILANTVRSELMNKWTSIRNMINYIIGVMLPTLLGFLLSIYEYSSLTIWFVILQMACFVATLFFTDNKEKKTCSFSIRKFISSIKENHAESKFINLYLVDLINGFVLSDSALAAVITLFILLLFKTTFKLGLITSIFALLKIFISFFFSRLKSPKKYPYYMMASCLMIIISMVIFILYTNNITFIIYNLFYNIASSLITIIIFTETYNVSNSVQSIKRSFQLEFLTIREFCLNIGRILSFILFLIAGYTNTLLVYQGLLLIFSLCIVIMAISSIKIEKEVNNEE